MNEIDELLKKLELELKDYKSYVKELTVLLMIVIYQMSKEKHF